MRLHQVYFSGRNTALAGLTGPSRPPYLSLCLRGHSPWALVALESLGEPVGDLYVLVPLAFGLEVFEAHHKLGCKVAAKVFRSHLEFQIESQVLPEVPRDGSAEA